MSNNGASMVFPPKGTTATATSTTATAAIATNMDGWMRMKAVGGTIYVLFGSSTVATPTASNSWPISDGETMQFCVGGGYGTHFRALAASGTPTLFWDRA